MQLPTWLWRDPRPLYKTSPYITCDPDQPERCTHFVQVFQSVPFLEPLYSEWEKKFGVATAYDAIRTNKWLPIVAVILYLSFLVEGKKYVERREKEGKGPVQLGRFPAVWNGMLALFSICGALRVVPHFLFMFTHMDFKTTVCLHPAKAGYGDGAAGLWVMLFTLSKVFELVDTVILVLKGKDPMFLHWYVGVVGCVGVGVGVGGWMMGMRGPLLVPSLSLACLVYVHGRVHSLPFPLFFFSPLGTTTSRSCCTHGSPTRPSTPACISWP